MAVHPTNKPPWSQRIVSSHGRQWSVRMLWKSGITITIQNFLDGQLILLAVKKKLSSLHIFLAAKTNSHVSHILVGSDRQGYNSGTLKSWIWSHNFFVSLTARQNFYWKLASKKFRFPLLSKLGFDSVLDGFWPPTKFPVLIVYALEESMRGWWWMGDEWSSPVVVTVENILLLLSLEER